MLDHILDGVHSVGRKAAPRLVARNPVAASETVLFIDPGSKPTNITGQDFRPKTRQMYT
jgi:hypothetical protein